MGEQADYIINKMMDGDWSTGYASHDYPFYNSRRREATEVAEDVLDEVKNDRNVKRLNKDIIKW